LYVDDVLRTAQHISLATRQISLTELIHISGLVILSLEHQKHSYSNTWLSFYQIKADACAFTN